MGGSSFSDPARAEASRIVVDVGPRPQNWLRSGRRVLAASTVTIALRDPSADLTGRYTVSVFVEPDPDGQSFTVPFTVQLVRTGQVSGVPSSLDAGRDDR